MTPLAGSIALGHNVKIGYYAQTHENLNGDRAIIDEIRDSSLLSEEGARTFLGRFQFTGDDVFKPISVLSGGERSRVALAKLTMQGANFLALDEPTNHLDLPAREFLETVLADYDGTLLFVSHDRYFIDAVASRVWIIEEGSLRDVEGNYTTYRQRIVAQVARAQAQAKASQRTAQAQATRERQLRARERTVTDVEADVAAAEQRVADLEAAINAASEVADVARITALAEEYATTKDDLDMLYAEWEALAQ